VDVAGASARAHYGEVRRAGRRRRAVRAGLAGAGLLLALSGLALSGPVVLSRAGDPGSILRFGLIIAGIVLLFVALLRRADPDPERWLRGAAGEQRSAIILEQLSRSRWHVFHDRAVAGFSLNHLVIGPSGVWLIDTKAFRVPVRGRWHRVDAGGRPIDTAPVAWAAELVGARLGVAVTPIVAVHGTGLGRRGRRAGGVRIVPAAALVPRVRRRSRWISGRRTLSRRQARELARRVEGLFAPRAQRN
jgi:hypothetical protein